MSKTLVQERGVDTARRAQPPKRVSPPSPGRPSPLPAPPLSDTPPSAAVSQRAVSAAVAPTPIPRPEPAHARPDPRWRFHVGLAALAAMISHTVLRHDSTHVVVPVARPASVPAPATVPPAPPSGPVSPPVPAAPEARLREMDRTLTEAERVMTLMDAALRRAARAYAGARRRPYGA